jgi:hypothetical protein
MLDETADFDCDGTVTQSDVDVVTAHMDHVCRTTTSVRPSSWGRVKFLYR